MDWVTVSEVCAGLVILGKASPNAFSPVDFIEPYPKAIKALQGRRDIDIGSLIGPDAYDAAVTRAKRVARIQSDWPVLLARTAARHDGGERLKKIADKLIRGEDADLTVLWDVMHKIESRQRQLTPMSEIKPNTMPHVLTGWRPIDDHLGGAPKKGLVVIGAPPKTGKTSLILRIAKAYALRKKKFVMFSLEMSNDDLAARWQEFVGKKDYARLGQYVHICDEKVTPAEIGSITSRLQDADAFAVDFADLAVEGDVNEGAMSNVYKTLAWISKLLGIPGFVASQLSRGYAVGRLPRLTDLRMTGIAEAAAWQVWLLYNPHQIYIGQIEDTTLEVVDGYGWLIVAASRSGFQRGAIKHAGTGAIRIAWNGGGGWGDKAEEWKDMYGV